ncbi:hypothetical protein IMCC26134_13525 [Verrucomicrobia bacterium IMCC26134]|jgi:ribosome-associated heat shock protein Hsp15|nr:hypothetical protein IMCC26134_13525 [Verrucomicrobia bacterium IMCC26134]
MAKAEQLDANDALEDARLDKWLWTVRVFKTRPMAAEACRSGRVQVNGREAKAAHSLRAGQIVEVRVGAVTRKLVMLAVPRGRQAAARLSDFMRDETPPEVYARAAEISREQAQAGAAGKPVGKRDRRARRELWGEA